jgi:hypothetical protein
MTTLYLVLKVSALLLVIVLPLAGPKRKKIKNIAGVEISDWAINETGSLERYVKEEPDHHPVK